MMKVRASLRVMAKALMYSGMCLSDQSIFEVMGGALESSPRMVLHTERLVVRWMNLLERVRPFQLAAKTDNCAAAPVLKEGEAEGVAEPGVV